MDIYQTVEAEGPPSWIERTLLLCNNNGLGERERESNQAPIHNKDKS